MAVRLTTLNTDWAMLAPLRCGASPSDWLSSTSTLKYGSLASLQPACQITWRHMAGVRKWNEAELPVMFSYLNSGWLA